MEKIAPFQQRRVPRVFDFALTTGCRMEFPASGAGSALGAAKVSMRMLDISELGALLEVDDASRFQSRIGEIVVGRLFVGDAIQFQVDFRFVRVGFNGVGIEFHRPSRRMRSVIRTYFRAELAGASMFEVSNAKGHYQFRNSALSDLDIQVKDGEVQRFVLTSTEVSASFKWVKGNPERLSTTELLSESQKEEKRRKLAGVIRNISLLNSVLRQQIADLIKREQIAVDA